MTDIHRQLHGCIQAGGCVNMQPGGCATMMTTATDRIEKQIVVHAPRSRVWRALTNPQEFGSWFGAKVAGPFAPGARIRGPVTHKGYEHLTMDFTIENMEPEHLLSW